MMPPVALPVPACRLGESPVWAAAEASLYWVDVWSRRLHRWSTLTSEHTAWPLPAEPGCMVLADDGRLVVALATGVVRFDRPGGATSLLVHPESAGSGGRYNDGAVDPFGRLWLGSVESGAGSATGSLYRIEPDGSWSVAMTGLATPNGIAFSPDGTRMYFTITERRQIVAYDFDPRTGELSGGDAIVTDTDGVPDGLVVDETGALWSAKWDGWRVSRYAPDGTLLTEIELPVPNVTSLAFGGPDLDRLYVTTAAEDTTATRPGHEQDAGRLFVIDDLGVHGCKEPTLAMASHAATS